MSSPPRCAFRVWQHESPSVLHMFRLDEEDRPATQYIDDYCVCVILGGSVESWYAGQTLTNDAGSIKLKEPGQVHRNVRIAAPFTVQGAVLDPDLVKDAARTLDVSGAPRFKAPVMASGERVTALAFALHESLLRKDATGIEIGTRMTELLHEALCGTDASRPRAPRAVRRAREYLHDAGGDKVNLDELAAHAALDKFRLVRAFRAEVGLPPYEYLTRLRISRARRMLRGGAIVAAVAQSVGFCDESQLHRHFRRIVGIAPGAYSKVFGFGRRRQRHPMTMS